VFDLENLKNETMTCVGSQRHRKKKLYLHSKSPYPEYQKSFSVFTAV